jgi:hypothetical protein
MPMPPSRLWKEMPPEKRLAAAAAFWRDEQGMDQRLEAAALLARRLKFRMKSVQALPVERRARFLAQVGDVSDALAGRALVAYHFEAERPLMSAFLDALGIAHEDGLIAADEIPVPDASRLAEAVEKLKAAFPEEAVSLYLRTLVALDTDTWKGLDALLPGAA